MSLFFTPWDRYLHIGLFPLPRVEPISIPGAPKYLQGLRILFLSDIHLRPCVAEARLGALIDLIAAQRADLILLGGDYAESAAQCARFFQAFQHVKAPLGCFGVPGNNDDPTVLPGCMEGAGVELLCNRAAALQLPGGILQIGGCDDHLYGDPQTRGLFPEDGYRILLSHYPVLPDCACELMLSGHTHGGQMNFFGVTPYSVGFEHSRGLLAIRGQRQIGNMRLAVCSGVGVSRLPLRIGAAPQILLVEFAG